MLSKVDSGPSFIKRIITGDETWIYEYDTHSRLETSEWRSPNEPRPKKHVVFSWKRRRCLRFSWITEVLCIMNSFQKARPATFSYSVDSRNRSAERATAPEMRSWKNRRWLWWLYRNPIIKSVSRIGSSADVSALKSMGSTLKGTISIMMNKIVFLISKIKS